MYGTLIGPRTKGFDVVSDQPDGGTRFIDSLPDSENPDAFLEESDELLDEDFDDQAIQTELNWGTFNLPVDEY